MGINTPFVSLGTDQWTGKPYHICSRKSLLVFAVLIALVLSMASERIIFKVMVDRMESYRYFLCQLMTFLYIPPLFILQGYRSSHADYMEDESSDFPKIHFFVMGILDLIHTMMLFIAGGRTVPTQTLFFLQANIPVTALLSCIFFSTRYSRIQTLGIMVITCGLIITLLPSLDDIRQDDFSDREAGWNSLFYLLASVPGSLSMLYKERTIRDRPLDPVYLNAWVVLNQFIMGLVLAPIFFDVETLHLDQKGSGLQCLISGHSDISTDHCQYGFFILVAYMASNVAMNMLMVQVITLTGVSVLNGSTIIGFALSFGILATYQLDPDDIGGVSLTDGFRNWLPASVPVDVLAFSVLLIGKVLYQSEKDPDGEATTTSAEDKEAASILIHEDDYGLRYT